MLASNTANLLHTQSGDGQAVTSDILLSKTNSSSSGTEKGRGQPQPRDHPRLKTGSRQGTANKRKRRARASSAASTSRSSLSASASMPALVQASGAAVSRELGLGSQRSRAGAGGVGYAQDSGRRRLDNSHGGMRSHRSGTESRARLLSTDSRDRHGRDHNDALSGAATPTDHTPRSLADNPRGLVFEHPPSYHRLRKELLLKSRKSFDGLYVPPAGRTTPNGPVFLGQTSSRHRTHC